MTRLATRVLLTTLATFALAGCATPRQAVETPAPTRTATDVDPALATPQYWLDQPANATVTYEDFEPLWQACRQTARDYGFRIDRLDFRDGLITTHPLISAQPFELWRRDVPLIEDRAVSTVATMRRTIRFEIDRDEFGAVRAVPKALVERQAVLERRVTAVVQYTNLFSGGQNSGTTETDRGVILPPQYWYAVGRDDVLERNLAESVRHKLR